MFLLIKGIMVFGSVHFLQPLAPRGCHFVKREDFVQPFPIKCIIYLTCFCPFEPHADKKPVTSTPVKRYNSPSDYIN